MLFCGVAEADQEPNSEMKFLLISGDHKTDYIKVRHAVVEKLQINYDAFDEEVKLLAKKKWRVVRKPHTLTLPPLRSGKSAVAALAFARTTVPKNFATLL